MLRTLDVSTSALIAHRQWLNTIAGNIANVNTTRDENGNPKPFQRRFVEFLAQQPDTASGEVGTKVDFRVRVDTTPSTRRVYEPGHPDADADGYVTYPNIDLVEEFANAVVAARAYEANVAAIEMTREMAELTLRILQ